METVFQTFPLWLWVAALGIAFFAGFVKGVVGFAMPLILVSGLGSLIAPELALAGLILPTVITNMHQALRSGVDAAAQAVGRFRWFLAAGGLFLILGAQVVPLVPKSAYFLMLGIPIIIFVLSQLLGWRPAGTVQTKRLDIGIGAFAGFFGGIAGVWGPPTVSYLTALNTEKNLQIQVQGVIYLLGAIVLVFAHVFSGVFTLETALFSLCLVPPAILGMIAGLMVHDRIDQETFRRATLVVLLLAGVNLVRRGVFV
ncbi:sulfite exporter TauE/SafE family protein [Aliishimia ponticola]|uniref:Probable membrane transporter protein n=1 Tax=Aliishimia ponticola TaxID=2499833 RepID=A0A4S4N7C2_9RHOB|nr:sulfite exporter TauE/SafE family protein [Aliishimia ponticola]THH35042.1 sulfite exporter TauE/SafE family protein [Aliishimia ponticola]